MSLDGILLNSQVAKVLSQVRIGVGLVFDVFSGSVQVVFLLLDVDVEGSNLGSKVNVSRLGGLHVLSDVVAIAGNSIDVLSEGADLDYLLRVEVLDSSDFSLGVIELNGFGSNVI